MRAHQVSRTAHNTSRLVLLAADDPQRAPLLPPGSAEATEALLRATGLLKDWHLRAYRSPRFKALLSWSERRLLPGATTHVVLRKRVIDDETRAALDAGVTQVLVVGAGFDTLALRLAPAHPNVRFWEVDHPATVSLKRHALEKLGQPPNLGLHPADLGVGSLVEALDEAGWDRRARSVVVVEGLLMALEGGQVADFLRGAASVMSPRSRLVGAHRLPEGPGGRLAGLSRVSIKAVGEPSQWSAPPEEVVAVLEDTGFTPDQEPGRVDLGLRYLVPEGLDRLPLAQHERIIVAERR